MYGLSKSRILAHRQCPRHLWLKLNPPAGLDLTPDGAAQARLEWGRLVTEKARELHPGGVLIGDTDVRDVTEALRVTANFVRERLHPLYEATFQADGVLVQADLMVPEGEGWRMVEVKSSGSVKPCHLEDAAVQSWVVKQAGACVSRTEIAHIDTAFVYPGDGDYRGLLRHVDVTAEIAELENEVPGWIEAARETLAGGDPRTEPGAQCRDPYECPYLLYCVPATDIDGFPPEILPNERGLAAQLRNEGFDDLRDVPEGRLTNPRHIRIREVIRRASPYLDPEAGRILGALAYPRYYLDFETVQFPIPVWAGTRPYQQIPFQWSCHIEGEDDDIVHREFLAEEGDDPRRDFAVSLLEALEPEGPILVYNAPFERGRMAELADAFPDLAPGLQAAIERLVDLLPIAREHYYHRDMRGSWSIKAVLPTIDPDLSYDELEIAHGGMAQEAFLEMMKPGIDPARRRRLREGLLTYCARDTEGLVALAHYLQRGRTDAP